MKMVVDASENVFELMNSTVKLFSEDSIIQGSPGVDIV